MWMRFLLLTLGLSVSLGACESPEKRAAREAEKARRENASILGGEQGKTFSEIKSAITGKNSSGEGMRINAYLWRASLESLSFLPITLADPFSGSIQSDWYSSTATPNERLRVDVFIVGGALKTDNLQVAVHKQINQNGRWLNDAQDQRRERALENAILLRARQLSIAAENR